MLPDVCQTLSVKIGSTKMVWEGQRVHKRCSSSDRLACVFTFAPSFSSSILKRLSCSKHRASNAAKRCPISLTSSLCAAKTAAVRALTISPKPVRECPTSSQGLGIRQKAAEKTVTYGLWLA